MSTLQNKTQQLVMSDFPTIRKANWLIKFPFAWTLCKQLLSVEVKIGPTFFSGSFFGTMLVMKMQ